MSTTASQTKPWAEFPFAPRKFPIFYGWVILAATIIGSLASLPGQTMGVGVFTDDLIAELGISRSRISLAYMCGTIASGLVLPWAGRVLDRIGARLMTVLSSTLLGLSLILMVISPAIAQCLPLPEAESAMLTISAVFFLLRFSGQGCLTLSARVALSNWFDRKRGLVIGIMGVFMAFGFNGSPMMLNAMLRNFGWQGASLILAAAVGLGMTAVGWLTYRDKPEDCGLLPDGDVDSHESTNTHHLGKTREFTRRQAIQTPAFWAFALGLGTQAFIFTALTFHIVNIGEQHGLDRETAYTIFIPIAFFGVVLNFISGWASDRYPMKWQLFIMMAAQATGSIGVLTFADWTGRALMIVGYGISMGIFGCLLTAPWPKFYGRLHLGGIGGVVTSIMVISSAIGPPVFAEGIRWFGDYSIAVVVAVIPAVCVLIFSLRADNPQDRRTIERAGD
jgi:OFA family oxalate/formate antiporter-like MFS transporter